MTIATWGEQLHGLREGAGCLIPRVRRVVSATGADTRAWLERITSNPVQDLAPGRFAPAAILDGKGKMKADLRLIVGGAADEVLLDIPEGHAASILRLLDMFLIREDVTLADRGADETFVSVAGPRAGGALDACGLPSPGAGEVASSEEARCILPSRLSGTGGFDLVVPAARADAMVDRLAEAGATRVSIEAVDLVRIEQGVPWFSRDLADGVIPLEALLDDHVSTTKGCYPGQEVVARIRNFGTVARRLVRLEAGGRHEIEPGAELFGVAEQHEKRAGRVTSVVHDPLRDITAALGFARRSFWSTGTEVRVGESVFSVFAVAD